jgi:hypothetical protein
LGGPAQNGRPATPAVRRVVRPELNHKMPVINVPNGTTKPTAMPISQVCLMLSHHGPKASEGSLDTLINAAIPMTNPAIDASQISAKKMKNAENPGTNHTREAYGGLAAQVGDSRSQLSNSFNDAFMSATAAAAAALCTPRP